MRTEAEAPLAGLRVVEFTHMVMGPSIGLVLAELGADVIKVEPVGGDATRRLKGSGAGYFPMFNRSKRSICLDLKSAEGLASARQLAASADIVIENFRARVLDRLGLGYETLSAENPRLIYCSAKGFLKGPYENRAALDEVAQMMGGLAYMTGPPGRPLRAGASVIDIAGGMFGVIGIMAALEQRWRTGVGKKVVCSLYETTAFFVGQHMAQKAVTGVAAPGRDPGRGRLRRVRDQRRRERLHRRRQRPAVGAVLRRLRPDRAGGRREPRPQHPARRGARPDDAAAAGVAEDLQQGGAAGEA